MDTQTAPVDVTERAAQKALQLGVKEGHGEDVCLRLRVLAGGCSGFSYKLSFEDGPADDDLVTEHAGLRVLVDPGLGADRRGLDHRVRGRDARRRVQGEQPPGRQRVLLRRVVLGLMQKGSGVFERIADGAESVRAYAVSPPGRQMRRTRRHGR